MNSHQTIFSIIRFSVGCISGLMLGCASDKPYIELEQKLVALKSQRQQLRTELSASPDDVNSVETGNAIQQLNLLVTETERQLSYAPTEPVSTQPREIEIPLAKEGKALNLPSAIWQKLTHEQQIKISRARNVNIIETAGYGFIIDAQVMNASEAGTSSGKELGSQLGQAAYIDNALRGAGYSAVNQIGAGIIGALIGSTLDRSPLTIYRIRYHIRLSNGNLIYADDVSSTPFTAPKSACIVVATLSIEDQDLCNQTIESIKRDYLD